MERIQLEYFRNLAECGNRDPWGQAYRAATGRARPPANVMNGTKFAESHTGCLEDAMRGLLCGLCPDDDSSRDSAYHRQVRLLASFMSSGPASSSPTLEEVEAMVKALPNTASRIDGVDAKVWKQVWTAAPREFQSVVVACVTEEVFPNVLKDGRLIVLPKGNGKPLSDPKAYRPITLLPIFGKLLERIIQKCAPQIAGGISDHQHGFCRGKSTVSALQVILSRS